MTEYPPTRTVEGREQLNRSGIAQLTGVSESHLSTLWRQRATNGHPAPVARVGQSVYWDRQEWQRWYAAHKQAQRDALTPVTPGGDPDELVTMTEAARMLGYASSATIRKYIADYPDYFPRPDSADLMPSGRERRLWFRRTILEFADGRGHRPRSGRPPGTGTASTRPRYADHPHMPAAAAAVRREPPVSTAEFARVHDLPEHTARRLLAAAREGLAADHTGE